jgi:ABC-2 type transport system permease protein
MRITAITELTQPVRFVPQLTMVVTQLALTWWLWRALYVGVRVSAGLDVTQATSYALLGVLYLQFRSVDRWSNGDTMVQLMFEGTIAYWFTRPVSPRRWYLIRMCGDLAYGGAWALTAYGVCRAIGVIAGPPSLAAGGAALLTLALGLVITYYLQVIVDLMCFWSTVNDSAVTAVQFASSLLSGAFAPLWFFPGWFQRADSFLPFQSTLNVPLSLYVGRLPVSALGSQVPFSILPLAARAVLTYVLPVAFVAYLPAAVLTGRVASTGVPEWLAFASPAAGPLLYILARYAWYRALRHYESVGG